MVAVTRLVASYKQGACCEVVSRVTVIEDVVLDHVAVAAHVAEVLAGRHEVVEPQGDGTDIAQVRGALSLQVEKG